MPYILNCLIMNLLLKRFQYIYGTNCGLQLPYLSTVEVTLDTEGDSSSLEFFLVFGPFISLFGTRLGSLLIISTIYNDNHILSNNKCACLCMQFLVSLYIQFH